MQQTFWQSIATTSWWSFIFFLFFCVVSYYSTKPREIPLKQLTSALFTVISLSIVGMYCFVKPNTHNIMLCAYTFMLGTGLGWLHFRVIKLKGIAERKSLFIPGNWYVAMLFAGVVIAKFYGYRFGMDQDLFSLIHNSELLMSFYGLFTGLFFGRWAYGTYLVKHGPFYIEATQPSH